MVAACGEEICAGWLRKLQPLRVCCVSSGVQSSLSLRIGDLPRRTLGGMFARTQFWRGLTMMTAATMGCAGMQAQTADPTATPPNVSTSAPAARAGSYSVTQGELTAAPGLVIPNGNLPWALEKVGGNSELIPIHHSSITEPAGVDTEATGLTHTLPGAHARTVLRSTQPVFFIHTNDKTENTGDAGHGNPTGWALVVAVGQNGSRTMPHVRFSQISQGTACAAPVLCLQAESLPDGWLRLTTTTPLEPGDYALLPVHRQPKPGVVILYDFAVDPMASQPKDAVVSSNVSAPVAVKRRR